MRTCTHNVHARICTHSALFLRKWVHSLSGSACTHIHRGESVGGWVHSQHIAWWNKGNECTFYQEVLAPMYTGGGECGRVSASTAHSMMKSILNKTKVTLLWTFEATFKAISFIGMDKTQTRLNKIEQEWMYVHLYYIAQMHSSNAGIFI